MKKHIIGVFIILSLGIFSLAQGTQSPFDAKKSQEEFEIMKGILGTTLSFVRQDTQMSSLWRYPNISAFYLSGQGAVFVIPTSAFHDQISREIELARLYVDAATRPFKQTLGTGTGAGTGTGTGSGIGQATPAPPAPPAPQPSATPPTPPAPPAPPSPPSSIDREALRKKVEEYQATAKKSREEAEANRQKLLQSVTEVKALLIETLANYGDSMTTVKPGEYINLVLVTDGFDANTGIVLGGQRTRHDIISAQKSWITDYKAGRLSLENFKQKVLQYTE